jgi:hypothetical protein
MTEIYTSEDEEEMMLAYAEISAYKHGVMLRESREREEQLRKS